MSETTQSNPCNHRSFEAVTLRMQREMQGNPDPCPWCEIEWLREVIARCYMRMQCADVPREPWHWEVCTTLDNTGIPSSHEPSAVTCTPEEQAGPYAKECPTCRRMTLHQYTNECMYGCGAMKSGEKP